MNSDVATDIPLADVYRFHMDHEHPATLVLCDDPEFNSVRVNTNGLIESFNATDVLNTTGEKVMTFTGIQVLDPIVLEFIPENQFFNSIDAYQKMINNGFTIAGLMCTSNYWKDIGDPARYTEVVRDHMAPVAFKKAFGQTSTDDIITHPLKGGRLGQKMVSVDVKNVFPCHG